MTASPSTPGRSPYFGCLVGRYGNRIANARFALNGPGYPLEANDGTNSLHGGRKGFDKVVWAASPQTSELGATLELGHRSAHLDQGFPGNLDVVARYTLTNDGQPAPGFPCHHRSEDHGRPSHHSYFNLAGRGDILGHRYSSMPIASRPSTVA